MTNPILAALTLLLSVNIAHASDAGLAGVWEGTIGGQSVVACFDSSEDYSPPITGWYYYTRYRLPIALQVDARSSTTNIRERSGRWELQPVDSDQLAGDWRSADGKRRADLRLERVSIENSAAPDVDVGATFSVAACRSDAFNRELERDRTFHRSGIRELAGLRFRRLHLALADETGNEEMMQMDGVELVGDDAALRAINQELQQLMPDPEAMLECWRARPHGEWVHSVSLGEIRAHWPIVTVSGHAWCTNAWGVTEDVLLFDLRTGDRHSPLDWFESDAPESTEDAWRSETLPTALADLLASRLEAGDQNYHFDRAGIEECYSGFADAGWRLIPTGSGIEFILPITRNGSCGEKIELPASDLLPLLNRRGREAFAALGFGGE